MKRIMRWILDFWKTLCIPALNVASNKDHDPELVESFQFETRTANASEHANQNYLSTVLKTAVRNVRACLPICTESYLTRLFLSSIEIKAPSLPIYIQSITTQISAETNSMLRR